MQLGYHTSPGLGYIKPRRLETYVYSPRSKVPPNWQKAQSFVRALCLGRVGPEPYWGYSYNQHRLHMVWRARYKAVRAEIQAEDYPINP
jgi:hypothetical protein